MTASKLLTTTTLRLLLILAAALMVPTRAGAEIYQKIRVDILHSGKTRVDGTVVELADVADAIKRNTRGTDPINVMLYIPLPVKDALLKDVMNKCREGGAKAFSIAYKS